MTSLRKVICVLCSSIFKVEQDPPRAIVDDSFTDAVGQPVDPFSLSAVRLRDTRESGEYCRRVCPWCRQDSPWRFGLGDRNLRLVR
jgi:hypothetical protein